MNLVDRIKGILLQPKSEWSKIDSEPGDAGYLLSNYVAIVAAIAPICTFIGTSIIGLGGERIGIGLGLFRAVVVYALTLIGFFVVGYIIIPIPNSIAGMARMTTQTMIAHTMTAIV